MKERSNRIPWAVLTLQHQKTIRRRLTVRFFDAKIGIELIDTIDDNGIILIKNVEVPGKIIIVDRLVRPLAGSDKHVIDVILL